MGTGGSFTPVVIDGDATDAVPCRRGSQESAKKFAYLFCLFALISVPSFRLFFAVELRLVPPFRLFAILRLQSFATD